MGSVGEVLRGDQHEAIRSLRGKIKDKEQTIKNKQRTRSRTKKKQVQETKPENKRQDRLYRTQGKNREHRQTQGISSCTRTTDKEYTTRTIIKSK